jgi:hypothetical protein
MSRREKVNLYTVYDRYLTDCVLDKNKLDWVHLDNWGFSTNIFLGGLEETRRECERQRQFFIEAGTPEEEIDFVPLLIIEKVVDEIYVPEADFWRRNDL